MSFMLNEELLERAVAIARRAGARIRDLRGSAAERKGDASPVTEADRAADRLISEALAEIDAESVIVSEEGNTSLPPGSERFWLVDPLDGTKGFIRGGKDYTVNIALIEHGSPRLGVIYQPETDILWAGMAEKGAFREAPGERRPIAVRPAPEEGLVALISHYHASSEVSELLRGYRVKEMKPLSSSLKFCVLAEGSADLYPRLGPTMEWDTAAGQAILEAAGGKVTDLRTGEPLRYGKKGLRNGGFLAVSHQS